MNNVSLRAATALDMPDVLALIQELALYERAPEEVTITLQNLVDDGFTHQLFSCIVAEVEKKVVGMALYYPRYSTWKGRTIHLEDFVVKQDFRNLGIGQLLFDAVLEAARQFGAKRLEWLVLEWNEPALKFYAKNKAVLDGEWHIGKIILA